MIRRHGLYNPVMLQQEVHDAVDALMSMKKTRELEGVESLARLCKNFFC